MNKKELVEKINSLDALTVEEKSALIDLLKQKKYGLVWENKPEDVEERLRAELPVLKEVTDKALLDGGEDAPNHILIEGDNLEALTALAYTHENSVDVIYIDPPYNTGNKDFVYNDSFVDSEDGYRHSKWLSFMEKRLRIAKRLLSEKGVIFISIDDNEQANLKLLCDEVFLASNFIGPIIWKKKTNGNNMGLIPPVHDYILVYANNLSLLSLSNFGYPLTDEYIKKTYSNPDNDPRGPWTTTDLSANHKGPYFPITNPKTGEVHYPSKGRYWVFNENEVQKRIADGRIIFGKTGVSKPVQRVFLKDREVRRMAVESWWDKHGLNEDGTVELNSIFGEAKKFVHPKPTETIKRILQVSTTQKEPTILDFFAGSGTTLHATMLLNAEDGGSRKCILVTNNENNICEEVTYERNKRVINGYTTPKGEEVEGLKANNLRYYQIDHVERESSLTAKRKLMAASAELLCIKHDIYEESTTFGTLKLKPHIARYFSKGDKKMLIIYMVEAIERIVEEIETMPEDTNIMVYVFSTNNYAMDADFEDVADKVKLCALPAAIYNAYLKVLPKKGEPKQIIEEDAE